jgi:IS5 family transposase
VTIGFNARYRLEALGPMDHPWTIVGLKDGLSPGSRPATWHSSSAPEEIIQAHPTVFTKNRERLLRGDIARAFFERVLAQAQGRQLLSGEHITVDGTVIEAWAGLKSFKKKGSRVRPPDDPGNPTVNFHGERRSNATHASTTDPEARSQGHEAKLACQGHVLMENRHGLVVDTCVSQATGIAERETAVAMATNLRRGATLGADKGYDTRGFVAALRSLGLTPHVAQNTARRASGPTRFSCRGGRTVGGRDPAGRQDRGPGA